MLCSPCRVKDERKAVGMGDHGIDGTTVPSVAVAHVSEDGRRFEPVRDHLNEVARMAGGFACPFHAESLAYAAGLLHDIGKYSRAFQQRILHHGPKVDHSTAGAAIVSELCAPLAYCIAGHHGGLPDGGSLPSEESTLYGRIYRAQHGKIPNCDAWRDEIEAPDIHLPDLPGQPKDEADAKYTLAFLTRMIFSCLVDADYLCTERFMQGEGRERLRTDALDVLKDRLEAQISQFYPPETPLNEKRCQLLDECRERASLPRGVFSLTAPTGAGKTYALMRFALQHACGESGHGMRRVIVAEPYTSIIEQNADVYRTVFGDENVLEHHANYDFDAAPGDDGVGNRLRLAAENWDAPIVVTTNVQLFESLYSNKTSRCRKLHNIVGSVIVLDEAQMIPADYLLPCIRALAELVKNYGCSVVLSSATQPALNHYFERCGLPVTEVVSDVPELFGALERVVYRTVGRLGDDELVQRMCANGSALCIVNSRRQALHLFEYLESTGVEGSYCLTTLMHPVHRRRILAEIDRRMREGGPCYVVATSLVEAGVDLDFSVVYRALAGVDSMVQAAGRCNREGKRSVAESSVFLFEPEDAYRIPFEVKQRASVALSVAPDLHKAGQTVRLGMPDIVSSYFRELYFYKGEGKLDSEKVVAAFSEYPVINGLPSIDFKSVSARIHMIQEGSYSIVIPDEEVSKEIKRVKAGVAVRGDMRRLASYAASVYERDVVELLKAGAIEKLGDGMFLLLDGLRYREQTGLDTTVVGGEGVFL